MGFSKPKAPKKTGEELATEKRTRSLLDKEIEEEEERFRMASRGQRGMKSLLGKAASNRKSAATKSKSSTSSNSSSIPSNRGGSITQGAYSRH